MEWRDPVVVAGLEAYATGWWWSATGGWSRQLPERERTSSYNAGTYDGFLALIQTDASPLS